MGKSINEVIQDALREIDFEAVAKEAAVLKVKETVKDAIANQLKSYSDFGEALQKQIKRELQIDISQIQLPEYRAFLIGEVNKSLASFTTEEQAKEIAKYINTKVVGESRDEIEFSAFWDELCEEIKDQCDEGDYEVYSVKCEKDRSSYSSSDYWNLTVSMDGNRPREVLSACFSKDGGIFHVRASDSYELSSVATWFKALQFRKTKIKNLKEESVSVPWVD